MALCAKIERIRQIPLKFFMLRNLIADYFAQEFKPDRRGDLEPPITSQCTSPGDVCLSTGVVFWRGTEEAV